MNTWRTDVVTLDLQKGVSSKRIVHNDNSGIRGEGKDKMRVATPERQYRLVTHREGV